MAFSKRFPREVKGQSYPVWEELFLTPEEEAFEEQQAREKNIAVMQECMADAKKIAAAKGLKEYQTDIVSMAIALFNKRASHEVYWKESKCKEKFDKKFRP